MSWGRREDRKLYCPMSPVLLPTLASRSSTTRSMAAVPKPPFRQKGPVLNRYSRAPWSLLSWYRGRA